MQGPRLEQSLRQGLMMTPMMQQAVQMLQMSALELEQHVELELAENPTLELLESGGDPDEAIPDSLEAEIAEEAARREREAREVAEGSGLTDGATGDAAGSGGSEAGAGEGSDEPPTTEVDSSPVDTVDFENLFGGERKDEFTGGGGDEDADAGRVVEETSVLRLELVDVLLEQIERSDFDDAEKDAARILVTNLDENGYFSRDIEEFSRHPPCVYEREPGAGAGKRVLDEDEGIVRRVYPGGWEIRSVLHRPEPLPATLLEQVRRRILKQFDPPGAAARDARESLLVQLERMGEAETTTWRIVRDHFDDVARNRLPAIVRALGASMTEVQEAVERVRRLEPAPRRAFGATDAGYVVPDVVVEKVDGDWVVSLKDDRLPRLRVSRDYQRMYERERKRKGEVGDYLKGRLESAYWLIKSIQQRQRTIYRVSECIVRQQRDFLEYGPKHLRPMTLRVVADDLGIHESTVSRVTTAKYIQTPRGIFELKYFFSNAIETGDGEDASARVVKAVLKEIVAGEDPRQPLADQKLAELLAGRGYPIARRTVTKYREQLGILSARQRQQF